MISAVQCELYQADEPSSPGLQMHFGVYPWTEGIWNTKPTSTELQQCLVPAWFCVEEGERS